MKRSAFAHLLTLCAASLNVSLTLKPIKRDPPALSVTDSHRYRGVTLQWGTADPVGVVTFPEPVSRVLALHAIDAHLAPVYIKRSRMTPQQCSSKPRARWMMIGY